MSDLLHTPLIDLHLALGAKMVPFAGYEMPVQYPLGVMKEHLHCRAAAGLFDVSHMGQVILRGTDYAHVAGALETLIPVDILGLADGRQRYGFFLNDRGGIEDDLMLARRGEEVFMVVNAACKGADIALMRTALEPQGITVEEVQSRALIALQGPQAEAVFAQIVPEAAAMTFMDVAIFPSAYGPLWVSRSGYTGEDGYEISVGAEESEAFAQRLLEDARVEAIGLGARDSLRLEAGLCLYGHDMDGDVTPASAGLTWAIQKVRRTGGDRAGGFAGADVVLPELQSGAPMRRVGLLPEGRAPMREGVLLFLTETDADPVGRVTSGGFGPSVGGPVAMGYLPENAAKIGTVVYGELRGKRMPVAVAKLPFVPANFKR